MLHQPALEVTEDRLVGIDAGLARDLHELLSERDDALLVRDGVGQVLICGARRASDVHMVGESPLPAPGWGHPSARPVVPAPPRLTPAVALRHTALSRAVPDRGHHHDCAALACDEEAFGLVC